MNPTLATQISSWWERRRSASGQGEDRSGLAESVARVIVENAGPPTVAEQWDAVAETFAKGNRPKVDDQLRQARIRAYIANMLGEESD